MSYATDHPIEDAELSAKWSQWLAAREVGDGDWRKYALNELRSAVIRAMTADGIPMDGGSDKLFTF